MFTLLQRLWSYFFRHIPTECIVCWKTWQYLCSTHRKWLLWYPSDCYICQTPTQNNMMCIEHHSPPFQWVIIGFYYTRIVKHMIHIAKYIGSYHVLSLFAQQLCYSLYANMYINKAILAWTCCITFVPMYAFKEKFQRWFNQSQKLASYISEIMRIPCIPLLSKNTYTISQIKKMRSGRIKQDSSLYSCYSNTIVSWMTILLVDDVMTTWTTLLAVANVLHQAYPTCQIWWVCIARNK